MQLCFNIHTYSNISISDEDAKNHDNKLKDYFLPKIEDSQTSGMVIMLFNIAIS